MSQITPEQYEEIIKLPPDQQAVAMDSYKAAANELGEVPREVQRELMAKAMELASQNTDGEDIRERSELEMIAPPGMRLGRFECRPLSMGVIQILERIKHPLFSGSKKPMTMADVVAIMYCLCETDLAALVQCSLDGSFVSAANLWAFDLSMDELNGMQDQLAPILDTAEGLREPADPKPIKRRASRKRKA